MVVIPYSIKGDVNTFAHGNPGKIPSLHFFIFITLATKYFPVMIKSIGIRASPSTVYYSIVAYDNEALEIHVVDRINNPKALLMPEQLKFLRNTLCDIINEFHVTNACIRVTESNAQRLSIARIYIEGVVQELFASSTIIKYYVGQISSISSRLEINRADFKPYSEGVNNFMGIAHWAKFSNEERESIMSAISALNI